MFPHPILPNTPLGKPESVLNETESKKNQMRCNRPEQAVLEVLCNRSIFFLRLFHKSFFIASKGIRIRSPLKQRGFTARANME